MKNIVALLLFAWLSARAAAADRVETRVAPDMSIVTETALASPFVGQQVAIAYRLRVVEPPAAVDVDPQQFAGFWVEPAPLSDSGRMRASDGRFAEYTLRQVVVFPLYAGEAWIPPLRVKIRRSLSAADAGKWDVIGVSDAVRLDVRGVPGSRERVPLVGTVSGRMFEESRGGGSTLFLELTGTALLALFDPAAWSVEMPEKRVRAQQVDYDSMVLPGDLKGGGLPSLVLRRRWEIRSAGATAFSALTFPVFQPESGELKVVRIPHPVQSAAPATGQAGMPVGAGVQTEGTRSRPTPVLWFLAAAAAAAAWLLLRRIRQGAHPALRQAVRGLRSLLDGEEKMLTAPHPYFEAAHRVLQHCRGALSENAAARRKLEVCRALVERWRFSPTAPPPEARREVTRFFGDLLFECETSARRSVAEYSPTPSQAKPHMLE